MRGFAVLQTFMIDVILFPKTGGQWGLQSIVLNHYLVTVSQQVPREQASNGNKFAPPQLIQIYSNSS